MLHHDGYKQPRTISVGSHVDVVGVTDTQYVVVGVAFLARGQTAPGLKKTPTLAERVRLFLVDVVTGDFLEKTVGAHELQAPAQFRDMTDDSRRALLDRVWNSERGADVLERMCDITVIASESQAKHASDPLPSPPLHAKRQRKSPDRLTYDEPTTSAKRAPCHSRKTTRRQAQGCKKATRRATKPTVGSEIGGRALSNEEVPKAKADAARMTLHVPRSQLASCNQAEFSTEGPCELVDSSVRNRAIEEIRSVSLSAISAIAFLGAAGRQ